MRRLVGLGIAIVALVILVLLGHESSSPPAPAVLEVPRSTGSRGGGGSTPEPPVRRLHTIRGAPIRSIAGRVERDGNPVADAEVRLGLPGEDHELPGDKIVTGADGRFDFGPRPPTVYMLSATGEGARPSLRGCDSTDPTAPCDGLIIVLRACDDGARLSGHVRDASAGPIRGARITVAYVPWLVTTTDALGAFSFCAATTGYVVVSADGYGSMAIPLGARGGRALDVALVPELVLAGRVLRSPGDEPIADVKVDVTPRVILGISTSGGTGRTDDKGNFRIAGLSPGRYLVVALADGLYQTQRIEQAIEPGRRPADATLRLAPGATWTGKVTAGGVPVAGASLSVDGEEWTVPHGISQHDGSFVISGIRPGRRKLSVENYEAVSPETLVVASGEIIEAPVEVKNATGIRGRVAHRGVPISGAWVTCGSTSDEDGRYCCRVTEGTHEVWATGQDLRSVKRTVAVARGETQEVDLELDEGATVEGWVVDEDGVAIADGEVGLSAASDYLSGHTDPSGRFTIRGVLPGATGDSVRVVSEGRSLELVPERPDLGDLRQPLHLLVKRPHFTVAGRVVDEAGDPAADVPVMVRSPGFAATTTDAEGRFFLTGLRPGEQIVAATTPSGREGTTRVQAGEKAALIALRPPGRIEGTLVGFASEVTATISRRTTSDWREMRIDGTHFVVEDLAGPDMYELTVTSGEASDATRVSVEPGQTAHVQLGNRGHARLTLKIAEPSDGVTCFFGPTTSDPAAQVEAHPLFVDASGVADLGEVVAGRGVLECQDGDRHASVDLDLAPGDVKTVELRLSAGEARP